MAAKIKVIVTGALGKMGTETLKAVWADEGLELVGAIDSRARGEMLTDIIGIKDTDMKVENDLDYIIVDRKPQVMIDFTK